jgi:hypothetical protein
MEIEIPGYIYSISTSDVSYIIMSLIIWMLLLGLGIWSSKYYDIKN